MKVVTSNANARPLRAALILIAALSFTAMGCGGTADYVEQNNTRHFGRAGYPVALRDTGDLKNQVIIEKDVPIITRDGTRLSALVFRPKKPGKYPVVMSLTAYGKDKGPALYPGLLKLGMQADFDLGSFRVSSWTPWEGPDPAFWVPNGYAVVYVDTRGYFQSKGKAGLFSSQDARDYHDAIQWAGKRPWSNGNVGLNGVSYLAIAQWAGAGTNPSHLKAIIPWEGASDSFREVLYHGGIPETSFTSFWLSKVKFGARNNPAPPGFVFRYAHKRPRLLRRIQKPPAFDLKQIKVPALICATWSDQGLHTRGSFEAYKKISSKQKWLFTHGRQKWHVYYSREALQYQKDFFDHFLKGKENGMDRRKSVRLEVRESLNQYQVRYEDSWPIARTRYQKLYMNGKDKTLGASLPARATSANYDSASGRAVFTMRFDKDTELSGNMKLKLWVSTDKGSDLDLFVGVHKLDARGKEVHFYAKTGYKKGPVAMGWLRVSERELDREKSKPWQPVLTHRASREISSGEIVPAEIEILPSSTLFRAGESLRLVVQGKDHFKHPAMGHAYSVNGGAHLIHAGGRYDSHLLVPVVPR